MQLTDGRIRSTGTNVSGYTLFRVSAMLRSRRARAVGSGRIAARSQVRERTKSPRPEQPRPPTRAPAKSLSKQEEPEACWSSSAPTGPSWPSLELSDLLASATPTERGVSRRVGPIPAWASKNGNWCLPDGRRSRTWSLALRLGPARPPCRLRPASTCTDRERAPARQRSDNDAEERRAGTRLSRPGRDQQLRASSMPLPTLFSFGLAGALSIRARSAAPHIATASSTLRSGRSQAASASGLDRIAGIRSWTGATTRSGSW